MHFLFKINLDFVLNLMRPVISTWWLKMSEVIYLSIIGHNRCNFLNISDSHSRLMEYCSLYIGGEFLYFLA